MNLNYGDKGGAACAECGATGELLGIEWRGRSTLLLCEPCALKTYCCIGFVAVFNATGKMPAQAEMKRIDKALKKHGTTFGSDTSMSIAPSNPPGESEA